MNPPPYSKYNDHDSRHDHDARADKYLILFKRYLFIANRLTSAKDVITCYQQIRQASGRKVMLKFGGFLFFKGQSRWKDRLAALLAEYSDVHIRFMGFPEDWQASPLWNNPSATKNIS